MTNEYTLAQAVEVLGITAASLRRDINAGKISARQQGWGKRQVWVIDDAEIRRIQAGKQVRGTDSQFWKLWSEYIRDLETGYTRGKPATAKTISNRQSGMKDYIRLINSDGDMSDIVPDKLKQAITALQPDKQAKKCYYGRKMMIYITLIGFTQWLHRKGLASLHILAELRACKPSRVYTARRTVLKPDLVKKVLSATDAAFGHTVSQVTTTKTIIYLAMMAGLRLSELIHLEIRDVDLTNDEILVRDGKGHKQRTIGLRSELKARLLEWLHHERPASSEPYLVVNEDGGKFLPTSIQARIRRFAKRNGIDITAHGLRRTFATMHSDLGIPLDHIKENLGHADIKTTMQYVMTDRQQAVNSIKNAGKTIPEAKEPQKPKAKRQTDWLELY